MHCKHGGRNKTSEMNVTNIFNIEIFQNVYTERRATAKQWCDGVVVETFLQFF